MPTLHDLPPDTQFAMRHRLAPGAVLTVPGADGTQLTATLTDLELVWQIRDVGPMRIQLMEMLFNWRIALQFTHMPGFVEGGWCYFGRGWDVFQRAVAAAHAFDPAREDAPAGFDKEVLGWSAWRLKEGAADE